MRAGLRSLNVALAAAMIAGEALRQTALSAAARRERLRMKHRVLIVVTHLLGVGHLARAALIARALVEAGASVRLVTGGRPSATVDLAALDVVQLPPVHCVGTDFKTLRNEDGDMAGERLSRKPSRRGPRRL